MSSPGENEHYETVSFFVNTTVKSGKIRLLETEYDGEKSLMELKGFDNLPLSDKAIFELPYINTTLLINELINLQYEEAGGFIRVFEKSGMRKDRYSSLSYNYWVATELESVKSLRFYRVQITQ